MSTVSNGNGNGAARWQVWASFAGIGIVLVGAMFSLFLMANIAYTKATAMELTVADLSRQVHDQSVQIKVVCADLTEVETQFRASDQIRNIFHANDMRVHGMLWRKTFGAEFPINNAYYPTIAQDHPTPCA